MNRNGWTYKKLGDICESELGKTLNHSTDTGNLYPYLCAINILWDKIDLSTLKETRFEESEIGRYTVNKGDLLICEGGDVGRAAIWLNDEPILYQNALHRVRFDDGFNTRFYLYYLKYLKESGIIDSRYSKGVTIKHLVKSSLLAIPVPIPKFETQTQIVSELDSLKDSINMLQQQLTDLDELAMSIFYDMFGDPVANPKSWPIKSMGDVAPCVAFKGTIEPISGKFWLLNLDMIESQTGKIIAKNLCDASEIGNSTNVFSEENVLYSKLRPYLNKVVLPNEKGYCTSELLPLLPQKDCLDRVFLAYLLRSNSFVNYINNRVAGAKMPRVSMNDFRSFNVILPPITLQMSFASKTTSIEETKASLNSQIAEMQKLFASRMQYWFD